ncbi:MAG: hypothetical protein ACRDP6_26940 [Actinoallomurus sp.]
MEHQADRRRLLSGAGAAVGSGLLISSESSVSARAGTGSCRPIPPRPVAPVNQPIAARHGLTYTAMPLQAAGVDVEPMITINAAADVAAKRHRLVDYIWKGAGLPARRPTVRRGVSAPAFGTLTRVSRIDELTVPLGYGVRSTVFHILPRRPATPRIAIYHNGHGEPFDTMLRTIQGLLNEGCSVLACAMPFRHWNAQRITDPKDPAKRVELRSHDDLARWESSAFSALTFFLEPVAVALNHVIATYRPASVQMIGLSGGGWTTTVYAAIDPRVTRSYPTAGSLPFYLRPAAPNATSSIGDWEQRGDTLPGFYGIAGYLDLYVMAAAGHGRRQVQILNRFDSCCFAGVGHRGYAPAVSHRVSAIGAGHWEVLEDATHDQHTISPYALSVILWDLRTDQDTVPSV